ncbi:MAG: hypothetical protein ACE5I3_11010 [Phycisphaerae bacterium]
MALLRARGEHVYPLAMEARHPPVNQMPRAILPTKTRFLLLILLILAVWTFLWLSHLRSHEAVRETHAALIVGYASLRYLDEHGKPPQSIEDLFDVGLLCTTDDGYVQMPGYSLGVPRDYVRRVHLSFPDNVGEFTLQGGLVRSTATEEELVCIRLDGRQAGQQDWAYLWYRVANGKPSGIDWLDELMASGIDPSSQATGAPTGD